MSPLQAIQLEVDGSFNGAQQSASWVNTSNLSEGNPDIRLSVGVDTSSLSTGRYPDTQSVSRVDSSGHHLLSTLDGAANVVTTSF